MKISNGNMKIGKDTLIINITSATDCPSKRLGLCRVYTKCYAMKAERLYPHCLPYRREQTYQWDNNSAAELADLIILEAYKHKHNKIKYLRFSEAGDFRNQEDVDKMSAVADILIKHDIRVYGYTARRDLDFSKISRNMVVNGSDFMLSNSFTAVPKTKPLPLMCPGNCRTCTLCKSANGLKIGVALH